METADDRSAFDDDSLGDEARALSHSIEVIRRARGRKNPRDCELGSEEWTHIVLEFVRDLRWALGLPDDEIPAAPQPND